MFRGADQAVMRVPVSATPDSRTSREELLPMYRELSLRFYRSGPMGFDLYTRYM